MKFVGSTHGFRIFCPWGPYHIPNVIIPTLDFTLCLVMEFTIPREFLWIRFRLWMQFVTRNVGGGGLEEPVVDWLCRRLVLCKKKCNFVFLYLKSTFVLWKSIKMKFFASRKMLSLILCFSLGPSIDYVITSEGGGVCEMMMVDDGRGEGVAIWWCHHTFFLF